MRPLRVLIWHVHGACLYHLTTKSPHHFFVPLLPERCGEYSGKWGHIPRRDNVHDVPAEKVRELDFDCIVHQTRTQYETERWKILSESQRALPAVYIHIPAVRHVDGTARVQTVSREQNPACYDLLKAFKARTGVGVLGNTSFNTRGEPIVCTPRDAVESFLTSPLDALVIGPFILEKRGITC